MTESSDSLAGRLQAVRARIAAAARSAGRDPAAVTLVAVAKTQPAESIAMALALGQRVFGENRVQEAASKYPPLRAAHPDLQLHLLGPLQTNKAEDAIALFDVIQTLDRPKLAEALAKAMAKSSRRPRLLIQVNTGEEPQKAGVAPGDLPALLTLALDRLGLPVEGLMCIPPADEPAAPHFQLLRLLAERHGLALRSMGMSGDFETAVALGATHVRVGTAIFGARPTRENQT